MLRNVKLMIYCGEFFRRSVTNMHPPEIPKIWCSIVTKYFYFFPNRIPAAGLSPMTALHSGLGSRF